MRRRIRALPSLALLSAGALAACSSTPKRTIKIPDSAVPQNPAEAEAPVARPYVIKMSDGRRTWQIEIPPPDASTAFQARIPLDPEQDDTQGPGTGSTEADREMGKLAPAGKSGEQPSRSYLSSLARINQLFRKKQYELALIELVDMERSYPEDPRLLEMKGTLFFRLRKPELAREAWERALALDPDNAVLAQALESLVGE